MGLNLFRVFGMGAKISDAAFLPMPHPTVNPLVPRYDTCKQSFRLPGIGSTQVRISPCFQVYRTYAASQFIQRSNTKVHWMPFSLRLVLPQF